MKFTVTEVSEDAIEVWDGKSMVDKHPLRKHTDTYHVGKDHGFLPGDEVQIQIKMIRRKVEGS